MTGRSLGLILLYITLALCGGITGYACAVYSIKQGKPLRFGPGVKGLLCCAAGLLVGGFCLLGNAFLTDYTRAESYGAFIRAVTFFSSLGIGIEVASTPWRWNLQSLRKKPVAKG